MEHESTICDHIVKIIRDTSQTGQLVRVEDIQAALRGQRLVEPEDVDLETHCETIFDTLLKEHADLRMICGIKGIAYYFSVQSLSETYARILIRKSENPLRLIAEIVRENARLYPRPVPVDSFRDLPFGLTREEIADCLVIMRDQEAYQDIAQVVTSIGTPFLYSTRHLESDHAFMLAEWLDVGQVNNP